MNIKKILFVFILILILSIIILSFYFIFQKNDEPDINETYDFFKSLNITDINTTTAKYRLIGDTSILVNDENINKLYVYSSPVNYFYNNNLKTIDVRIKKVEDELKIKAGYEYMTFDSDLQTYYPNELNNENGVLLKDLNGIEYKIGFDNEKSSSSKYVKNRLNFIDYEKDMVSYNKILKDSDVKFYPSTLGTNCEISFNSKPKSNVINVWFELPDNLKVKVEAVGYLSIYDDSEDIIKIVGVIQKPILKTNNGTFSNNCRLVYEGNEGNKHKIKFILDNDKLDKNSTAFISFELRRSNQPDNALYSGLPDINNSNLANISVIGNDDIYGIGRLMIRFSVVNFFNLKKGMIKEINYHYYSLTNNSDDFELVKILEEWCSINGNWSKNYKTGERVTQKNNEKNEMVFNITDLVKTWCDDLTGELENNGVQLKSIFEKEGLSNILLSNDNTLYQNRTEIILN